MQQPRFTLGQNVLDVDWGKRAVIVDIAARPYSEEGCHFYYEIRYPGFFTNWGRTRWIGDFCLAAIIEEY